MTERDIFLAVLDLPDAAARAAYLDSACGGDAGRRARVEALLQAHENAGSFLADPAVAAPASAQTAADAFTSAPGRQAEADEEALGFLSPSQRPDSLGRIGHYEVLEVLGRGGFGIVFRAHDEVLQRVVAVKVLSLQMAATSPARKRFLREARSSAQVRHENVVQVYAVEEQPLPYLVMEFIPGETLQQRLDRTGPLDVPEALRIGRQIAEGLAAAHAQGLVHRDIKPANVMIEGGAKQRVMLTDFGLARAADDASISQSGVVAGTPMYMAPEQAKGESLDHRADLFSLGSVLYTMLTGHPPFRAASTLGVLKRVAEENPRPIREVIPEVPEWMCRIVEKLHAKDPAGRFQTAREVADLLADCETQWKSHGVLKDFSRIPGGLSAPRPRRLGPWKWAAAAAAILVLLGVVRFGPTAWLYLSNRGELNLVPQDGLVSVIVLQNDEGIIDGNKLRPLVTDWLDMRTGHTLKLPPGKYQLNAGANGRHILDWEVTTAGALGSDRRLIPGEGLMGWSVIVTVGRGERVTVQADLGMETPPRPGLSDVGWVPLFNGKDLTGWKTHPAQPGDWRVENGILIGQGPRSHLFSERGDYQDFHLRVEAKINNLGNSGVYFRSEYGLGWGINPKGYEAQIFEGDAQDPFKTGSLYSLAKVTSDLVKPNTWFTLEVIAQGNRIIIKVDGKTAVDFVDEAARYKKGHFALQVERPPRTIVQFRKIEVKQLPPSLPAQPSPPPAVAPLDTANSDHELIQGAWRGMHADTQGQPIPEFVAKAIRATITFNGSKVTWTASPVPAIKGIFGALASYHLEGVFHLDPTKSPKTIDLTILGQNAKTPLGTPAPRALLGIYKLDGDSLEICIAIDPENSEERPTRFESVPGKFISHIKLRRQPATTAAVERLRDVVSAKERALKMTEARFEAGRDNAMDLVLGQIALLDARIQLAEAEGDRAALISLLQELVKRREEERRLVAVLVEAGTARPEDLDQANGRVAAAKARLAKEQSAQPGQQEPAAKPPAVGPFDADKAK